MSLLLALLGVIATFLLIIRVICTYGAVHDFFRLRKGARLDLLLQLMGLCGAICAAGNMVMWTGFDYVVAAFFPLGLACLIEAALEAVFDNNVSLTGHHSYSLKYDVHGTHILRCKHFLRRTWRIQVVILIAAICTPLLIGRSDGWHIVAVAAGTGIALWLIFSSRRHVVVPQR